MRLFRRADKHEENKQEGFKNKVRENFFTHTYKLISNNLNKEEVRTMAKDINKETKEEPETKKTEVKSETKCCGCGCISPVKTK
jgi:hypothetical protein